MYTYAQNKFNSKEQKQHFSAEMSLFKCTKFKHCLD